MSRDSRTDQVEFGPVPTPVADSGVLRQVKQRDGKAMAAFTVLMSHANQHDWLAFPSADSIAKRINVKRRTVPRLLNRLEELGLIDVLERSGGRGKANVIRIVTHPKHDATDVMLYSRRKHDSNGVIVSGKKDDTNAQKGCHETPERMTRTGGNHDTNCVIPTQNTKQNNTAVSAGETGGLPPDSPPDPPSSPRKGGGDAAAAWPGDAAAAAKVLADWRRHSQTRDPYFHAYANDKRWTRERWANALAALRQRPGVEHAV